MIPTTMLVSPPHQSYWSLPPPAAQALRHQREDIARLERHGKLPGNSEHDSAEGALGGTQWTFRKFLDPTLKGPVFGTITRVEMDAFVAKFLAKYV